jgi:uncharacterized repeat protein (TIGR01451 family)/uncharacterized delta-60 repeat protein
LGFSVVSSFAQPANDKFANATLITGSWGTNATSNAGATAEFGEPSHAGFVPSHSIWYKWVAPETGDISLDTIGSVPTSTNSVFNPFLDTVLAVYTGPDIAHLDQVAANDDLYPPDASFGRITGMGQVVPFSYSLPYSGPSALHFNASAGTTYYIAVDSKGLTGTIFLSWAFRPSGAFRFATETFDFGTTTNNGTNTFFVPGTGNPLFLCSPEESLPDFDPTFRTYYIFDPEGVLVTVTRVAGSTGRMLVDYATQDGTALSDVDYTPVQGTLVFDDNEMSKTIHITISPFFRGFGRFFIFGDLDFTVALSNPRRDPRESPAVSVPRLDTPFATATVRIISDTEYGTDPLERPQGTSAPSHDVFNFQHAHYYVPEDVNDYWTSVPISVLRTLVQADSDGATINYRINNTLLSGDAQPPERDNTFPLQPGSDYAIPFPDYAANSTIRQGSNYDFVLAEGSVNFAPQDSFKTINFTITNDNITEFNKDFHITLWRDVNGARVSVGKINECTVTILFDDKDPPAGSVDEFHNADRGVDMKPPVATTPPNLDRPGTDGPVWGLAVQADNKAIIAGQFSSFNTLPRSGIARVNMDGSLDLTFDPGTGADDLVSSVALLPDGTHLLIGGAFTHYNSADRKSVARLNLDGSLDTTFSPGQGADGAIWAIAPLSNGKVFVAGEFTHFDGIDRVHIARLNSDGSVDLTFDPGTNAPNDIVWSLALQSNGKVLIGGQFTALGLQPIGGVARLNADGSADTAFNANVGLGVDGTVYSASLQADGKILIGGEFAHFGVVPRGRLARLNADGTLDLSFDPGAGASDTVYNVLAQPNGIYVGGIFDSYNGTHRHSFARIFYDGTLDTSFLDSAYNQFAGLHRKYFDQQPSANPGPDLDPDPRPYIYASALQSDTNVLIGGGFSMVGGGQANGDIRVDADYPATALNTNVWAEPKSRDGIRHRNNFARLIGGSTPGPGNLSLLYPSYAIGRSQVGLDVGLMRTNGTLGYVSANFSVLPGVAQSGTDYVYNNGAPFYFNTWNLDLLPFTPDTPNSRTRDHSDGFSGTNLIPTDIFGHHWFGYNMAKATISTRNSGIPGDVSTFLQLANPSGDNFYLGGENIPLGTALGRSTAPFTVVDDNHNPGVLSFASPIFSVNEAGTNAVITIIRTNGSAGTVSVVFSTSDGTGRAGSNYVSVINKRLSFPAGVTNQTVIIPILDDFISEPNGLTVNLSLTSVSGASLGLANATLNIVDSDYSPGYVTFSSASYTTNESSGSAVLTVNRSGSAKGTITVQCGTRDGTAINGFNYVGTTNTLVWNDGDSSPRYFTVPLIRDGQVGPNTSFGVALFNATVNTTNNPTTVLAGVPIVTSVNIIDDDFYGNLHFSAPNYLVNENGGYATITVVRTGGSAQSLSVNYATADGTAVSKGTLPNFVATSGNLTFNPGEVSKSFNVPLLDDGLVNPAPNNFFFTVNLTGLTPSGASFGFPTTAVVNIRDAQTFNQPAGSVDTTFNPNPGLNGNVFSLALQTNGQIIVAGDFTSANSFQRGAIARFNGDSTIDTGFLSIQSGANGTIQSVLVQTDGRILAGGSFTVMNGIARTRLVRLLTDGNIDSSFVSSAAADNTIFALAETFMPDRRILVGGSFISMNGFSHPGLARLMDNGSLDPTFDPQLTINGTVFAITVYPTNSIQAGKIIIGGDFTSVNGVSYNRIARLNPDGTLDTTFNPGTGAADTIRALAIQLDGRVLVGGAFTNFNGTLLNRYARLNVDGSLNASFNVGAGASDTVSAFAIQPDNRIVLVGQFTRASGVSRNRITRLLPDGTVDPSINFGAGADNNIKTIAIQPDGMLVIGGGFTQFDDQPRAHLARLYGGSVTGSGAFEFATGNFQFDENATNALITVRRRGGTSGNITVHFNTSDGTAVSGVNYSNVSTTLTFSAGETLQTVLVPIRDDLQITPDLTVNLTLSNVLPPAGLGDQPVATLTLFNDDSSVSFDATAYRVNEDVSDGVAIIGVTRSGSTRLTSFVEFNTTTNGTALANTNYVPTTNILTFLPGQSNLTVRVPILPTIGLAEGDKTVDMILTNANHTLLFSPFEATLTVVDVDVAPGRLFFAQTNYVVGEGDGLAVLTVLRTNGHTGTITVNFNTIPGSAIPGVKYGATNGVLTFLDGELSKIIAVPIIEENQVEGNKTFTVALSNPTGGATLLGVASVPVTIIDDDVGVGFSSPIYIATETGGSVTLTVNRVGTNGVTTVNYATSDATAVAGTNYVATSGTLSFASGELLKTFSIPLLRDPRVTGPLSFNVSLLNPSPPAVVYTNNPATVTINDADPGLAFTNANFYTIKSGTNVVISVVRSNANTGIVSVNYATADNTAVAGIDYVSTGGTLTFSNGIALQSFTVPIINNRLVEGDRVFSVGLFNPTPPAQILVPNIASVTITDNVAGLSFSSPSYKVNENGVAATITVLRTGYTNSTVGVDYATADGTAVAGANYIPVSGSFLFTNGETVKTFSVPVIDNSIPDGDKTVLLSLRNAVSNSVLLAPNAATLTIIETDGSLILPAGTALLSESGLQNGAIDPGETVSILFAFRNATGTNTVNLIGTLLATNGIINPSAPQNYGALTVHGPAVSRPFTFTANATNGQTISATFEFRDGNAPTNIAIVNFVVGKTSVVYSNTAPITINDVTNATPYPSIIHVSGLSGSVSKTLVTFTNLYHPSPSDIDALLVSPSGAKSYLMAKAGSDITVAKATLTFDDAASTSLPQSTQIVSGTYRPTSYALATPPFPVPAPPSTAASPYATNLSTFNGSNPNGDWSLFIIDDLAPYSGIISNGWLLNLTTATPVPANADVGVAMSAAPDPAIATSNVTYVITLTNYGPAAASAVAVNDTLPPGTIYIGSSASQGTVATNASGVLTWSIASLAKDATASLSLVLKPTIPGQLTNTAVVTTSSIDLNVEDDIATTVITVAGATSDLALNILGSPDPVLQDHQVTYTLVITNLGPATAIKISVTDTLPPGMSFVSGSPAGYSLNGNSVTFTNLGNLDTGGQVTAMIVARPSIAGTVTNTATCSSAVTDPLKLNNSASIKTVVEPVVINVTRAGGSLVFTWTSDAVGYSLERATNFVAPIIWSPVNIPPSIGGGTVTVIVPIGNDTEFFRLHGTTP